MSVHASDEHPTQLPSYSALGSVDSTSVARDQGRAVFGQVMGLVAATLGFLALGAYVGRDLSGAVGILFFIAGFACIFGLSAASDRGHDQLSTGLLFGLGLLLGLGLGPALKHVRAGGPVGAVAGGRGDRRVHRGARGGVGYAIRRDLSTWARTLFWALLGLIVFGIVAIFVSIPHANVIYAVAGLAIFGAYTVFDFYRLRRAGAEDATPLAASIFLDVLNVFLFILRLFSGENR